GDERQQSRNGGRELLRLSGRNKQRTRRDVVATLLIVALCDHPEEVVTHAEVQGEPRADVEIILQIERVVRTMVVDIMQVGDVAAIGYANQPGGEPGAARSRCTGVVGEHVIEVELAAR